MSGETPKALLTDPSFLVVWGGLVAAALAVLAWNLTVHSPQTPSLMKAVWLFTVLPSGALGLAVCFCSGRRRSARDSLPSSPAPAGPAE